MLGPGAGSTCPKTVMVAVPTKAPVLVWTVRVYDEAEAALERAKMVTKIKAMKKCAFMPYTVTPMVAVVEIGT